MRFTYCPHCGKELIRREIGDEGLIPYCESCRIPLWDMFTTCIICAVINENNEVALLRQDYVSTTSFVLVAGVMKLGESAEDTAVREVFEEIGQHVHSLRFVKSYPYEKKEMLMLGFRADVQKSEFRISGEVDQVQWVPLAKAPEFLRQGSIAWQLITEIIQT